MKQSLLTTIAIALTLGTTANAQLAKDVRSCKFLGNITTTKDWSTGEQVDWNDCKLTFSDYWNQVTCENATKWGSVHQSWGKFNWGSADKTHDYCKQKGILFKFHALIWGSQHPTWIENLSVDETKKAIIEWYDEVAKHYPDLQIIDVVNEAIYSGGDYHSPYKQTKIIQALGSLAEDRAQKETGNRPSYNCSTNGYPNTNSYQWIAEAFRLARERWPEAILIYNDYNTFQWQKTEFINLINGLKACGAPIDAAGNQAHDLNDMSGSQFKSALEDIHNKTQLPQYITEYDIAKKNDATFETRYKEQFPVMWEADYVAGVTLWGWIYGHTWVKDGGDNGASGLVRNCQKRSAFTWLEQYMRSDAAINAKSPLCVGQAAKGVTVKLSVTSETISVGDEVGFQVEASSKAGNVNHIEVYVNDELIEDKGNVNSYSGTFAPTDAGVYEIKVIAYDDKNESAEKTAKVTVCAQKAPYGGTAAKIPGTIEAEDFDEGCEGIAYHDTDDGNEGKEYRQTGIDVVTGNNSYAIGYTAKGEWTDYSVNVICDGTYDITAYVASGSGNSGFTVSAMENGQTYAETQTIEAPQGEDWDTYSAIKTSINLRKGEQTIRFSIVGPYINIDKVTFDNSDCETLFDATPSSSISIYPSPATNHISVSGVEEAGLKLIDSTGRAIATSSSTELDIPETCKGVYTLIISTDNNVIVKKIVIK